MKKIVIGLCLFVGAFAQEYVVFSGNANTELAQAIAASDVAKMLEAGGADQVVYVDLHCGQIQGFFQDIPVDNLSSSILFVPYIAGLQLKNPVVISPDAGGVERANTFSPYFSHSRERGLQPV